MSRENQDYRVNLEQLNRMYPDREMLTATEVMHIMGYKSQSTVRKHVPFVNRRVSKAALARIMCG